MSSVARRLLMSSVVRRLRMSSHVCRLFMCSNVFRLLVSSANVVFCASSANDVCCDSSAAADARGQPGCAVRVQHAVQCVAWQPQRHAVHVDALRVDRLLTLVWQRCADFSVQLVCL